MKILFVLCLLTVNKIQGAPEKLTKEEVLKELGVKIETKGKKMTL